METESAPYEPPPETPSPAQPWLMDQITPETTGLGNPTLKVLRRRGITQWIQLVVLERVIRESDAIPSFGPKKRADFAAKWPEIIKKKLEENPDDRPLVEGLGELAETGLSDLGLLTLAAGNRVYSVADLKSLTSQDVKRIIRQGWGHWTEMSLPDRKLLWKLYLGPATGIPATANLLPPGPEKE